MNNINRYIDHTILKANATDSDIEKLCCEAVAHQFYSVCVNPIFVGHCKKILATYENQQTNVSSTKVKVCAVVGFPLGATLTKVKVMETQACIENGADEIDMVISIGMLKSGKDDQVLQDIKAVVEKCHQKNVICKVILETCLLTNEEKERAIQLSIRAGADFVKTSTGFSTGGATVEDIEMMSKLAKETNVGVKASGGIRSLEDALKMIHAGATRLGASSGVSIMQGISSSDSY